MMPIAEIKDKESGYLFGDRFAVKLEMRYRVPENEFFLTSFDKKLVTCTVQAIVAKRT